MASSEPIEQPGRTEDLRAGPTHPLGQLPIGGDHHDIVLVGIGRQGGDRVVPFAGRMDDLHPVEDPFGDPGSRRDQGRPIPTTRLRLPTPSAMVRDGKA